MTSSNSWQTSWNDAQPRLDSISQSVRDFPKATPRVLRVGQLDAELLDQELVTLLIEPLSKALSLIKSSYKTKFQPEITFLVQLVLYKLSVWDTGATYGAKLQDLRYQSIRPAQSSFKSPSPSGITLPSLLAHASLTVVLPYVHNRLRAHALSNSWPEAPSSDPRRKAWELLVRLENVHATLGLFSFVAFLWDGKFRTIADRIIGLRLVPSRKMVNRNVSYEFMNRQIVWHVFTEFLLFLLPLINTRLLRRRLLRITSSFALSSLVPSQIRSAVGLSSSNSANEKGKSTRRHGKYWSLPEDECAICAENDNSAPPTSPQPLTSNGPSHHPITIPYITSCSHVYCYYCLVDQMLRIASEDPNEGWECLRCGDVIRSCARVEAEVGGAGEEDSDMSNSMLDSDDFRSSVSSD